MASLSRPLGCCITRIIFAISRLVNLPELADNITKGDSEQDADEDSRSYKDFSEVLLLQNIRITNHIDRHQSVFMLRKFSDLEIFIGVLSFEKCGGVI